MEWSSAGDFISMGGYGLYVWGAYGVTAALFALEGWLALRRRRRAFADALAAPTPAAREAQQ